jgi:DNA-binding beta-propeller fold protein YncE
MKASLIIAIVSFAAVVGASLAQARGPASGEDEPGVEFDLTVGHFAEHPSKPIVYASVPDENSVAAFLASDELRLLFVLPVGPDPRGLCVSPDGSRLYVGTVGQDALAVIDLATLEPLDPIPLPVAPYDVEAGAGNRVYVTPRRDSGTDIMQVDGIDGTYMGDFSGGVLVYRAGLLDVSPDLQSLFFVNRGLSPGTLAEFDISTADASLVWKNAHGALGSNGQDLAVSRDGMFVSYACGSGNGGYDIFKLSTQDYSLAAEFETGAYPREIVYGPNDHFVYTVHTQGHIDVFNASSGAPIAEIPTIGEPYELLVPRSGRYVFAAFANRLGVYPTLIGRRVGVADDQALADRQDHPPGGVR